MFILTSIIIFLADEFYLIAIVFSVLVTVLCLFVSFLTFNHSIRVKGKVLIIKQIKTIKIDMRSYLKNIEESLKDYIDIMCEYKELNDTYMLEVYL